MAKPVPPITLNSILRIVAIKTDKATQQKDNKVCLIEYTRQNLIYKCVVNFEFVKHKIAGLENAYGVQRSAGGGIPWRLAAQSELDAIADFAAKGIASDLSAADFASNTGANMQAVIMPFKKVAFDLADVVKAKDPGDVWAIVSALQSENNLKRLGSVIAADIFSGNGDRFRFLHDKAVVANAGNFMFVKSKSDEIRLKGMDPFDPNGSYSDMAYAYRAQDKEALSTSVRYYYAGRLLAKPDGRWTLAKQCMRALNEVVTKSLKSLNYEDGAIEPFLLTKTHAKSILKGIEDALPKIKGFCDGRLQTLTDKGRIAALQERVEVCGLKTIEPTPAAFLKS